MRSLLSVLLVALVAVAIIGCQGKPSEEELFEKAKQAQDAQDTQAAIAAYKDVVKHYPDGDKADEAQFMVGFLYANALNDLDNARTAYEAFLENYSTSSDSGMVLSARWELEHLGKDVQEIEAVTGVGGSDLQEDQAGVE